MNRWQIPRAWIKQARAALLAALSLFLLCTGGPAPSWASLPQPVKVETGLLEGISGRDPSITVFKGVPYAKPPLGELRWKAPQPPAAWQGVRKADAFGNVCPQLRRGGAAEGDEDCLFLNIWTGAASPNERRPVLVWFYGGRFSGGAGSDPMYDGEGLARKGLVVVTMNYRLGVLGFLATPELSKESGHNASGNYGLLDQIACLQWVHRNIAAFGGDPNRITIAGQSAGAASVGFLLISPLAKGLFHRAIIQSHALFPHDPYIGGLAPSWRSLEAAQRAGVEYAEEHGAHTLAELRAMSWRKLLEGSNANDPDVKLPPGQMPPPLFRPVVDGWVIPMSYSQSYAKGIQNDVPVLSGGNRDERGGGPSGQITLADYLSAAREKYGNLVDEFLKLYPAAGDQEAAMAQRESGRDEARVSMYLWAVEWKKAAKNKVFTYFWTHAPPGPEGASRGAYHGSEINYVFNNLYAVDRPWTDQDRRIADIMSSFWANFAATGDPNGKDLPNWPEFKPGELVTMEVGDYFGPIPIADRVKFDFIRRYLMAQKPW